MPMPPVTYVRTVALGDAETQAGAAERVEFGRRRLPDRIARRAVGRDMGRTAMGDDVEVQFDAGDITIPDLPVGADMAAE